jgi:hypothetical protein
MCGCIHQEVKMETALIITTVALLISGVDLVFTYLRKAEADPVDLR